MLEAITVIAELWESQPLHILIYFLMKLMASGPGGFFSIIYNNLNSLLVFLCEGHISQNTELSCDTTRGRV